MSAKPGTCLSTTTACDGTELEGKARNLLVLASQHVLESRALESAMATKNPGVAIEMERFSL